MKVNQVTTNQLQSERIGAKESGELKPFQQYLVNQLQDMQQQLSISRVTRDQPRNQPIQNNQPRQNQPQQNRNQSDFVGSVEIPWNLCWNCDAHDHKAKNCTLPRTQKFMERVNAYRELKRKRRDSNVSRGQTNSRRSRPNDHPNRIVQNFQQQYDRGFNVTWRPDTPPTEETYRLLGINRGNPNNQAQIPAPRDAMTPEQPRTITTSDNSDNH